MKDKELLLAFGRHLAQLRKAKGLSQETLSLKSGISRSYLGGTERGQRNISLRNITKLARTLKIPLSEMLDFEPGEEPGNPLP